MNESARTEPVAVRAYREADRAAWEAYVSRCPAATFFHRIGWKDIYEHAARHRTHYLLGERDGAIVGVLPLVQVKSLLFGNALVSLPFAVYGGAAADDVEIARALDRHAVALGRSLGVEHLELRDRVTAEPDWPRSDLHVTFRKALLPDVEGNLLAIPRKQRAMVRKAMQRGLTSHVERDVGVFFDLYADNQHRHGTPPHARAYFEALRDAFGDDCECLIVRDAGGAAVSGVLSFYFRDEVLPYYAGDVPAARQLAANDFKYWELMRRACERGLRTFDFGRSKRGTGSFDFKKNWGFEPTALHYAYALFKGDSIPQRNPSNPRYGLAIDLWRRMPRPVVNLIGPSLARHLG